jgi:hypothetical protein
VAEHENREEVVAWALIPYESAFTRDWYFGGIGDMRLPFVMTMREAFVMGAAAVLCALLLLLGASLDVVMFLAPMALFGPRLVRDKALDGKSLQNFLAGAVTFRLRAKTIKPDGVRRGQIDGAEVRR